MSRSKIEHIGMVVRHCYDEQRWAHVSPGVRYIPIGSNAEGANFDAVVVLEDLSANEYDWLMAEIGPRMAAGGRFVFLSRQGGSTHVEVERELA